MNLLRRHDLGDLEIAAIVGSRAGRPQSGPVAGARCGPSYPQKWHSPHEDPARTWEDSSLEMPLKVGEMLPRSLLSDRSLHKPRDGSWMQKVALNFVAAPPQPLQSIAGDVRRHDLRAGVAVDELDAWQIRLHENQCIVVLSRRNPVSSRPRLMHDWLPEQPRRQQIQSRVLENLAQARRIWRSV